MLSLDLCLMRPLPQGSLPSCPTLEKVINFAISMLVSSNMIMCGMTISNPVYAVMMIGMGSLIGIGDLISAISDLWDAFNQSG